MKTERDFFRLLPRTALFLACLSALPIRAQFVCDTPPVAVDDTQCTVTPGTTLPAGAAQVGVDASGVDGVVTANGITIALSGAGATGVLVQNGALVTIDGSTVDTTSTTAATILNQVGLRANGIGSRITGTDAIVTIGPPASGAASNLRGASAEGGASITLTNANLSILGGTNSLDSVGVQATDAGSSIIMSGGSIQTASRAAFGAAAVNGGLVTLDGTAITTTGVQNVTTLQGSHALYARDANSRVVATGVTATVSGNFANAARADLGGVVETRTGTTLSTTGPGNVTNPTAAARATTGGSLVIGSGTTLSGSGAAGYGVLVEDAGSDAQVSGANITVTGTSTAGLVVRTGGTATVTGSTISLPLSGSSPGVRVQDASVLDMSDTSVSTGGGTSFGVQAQGGTTNITGGSILTTGNYGVGLSAGNAVVNATDVTITTAGDNNAMGVLADAGAQVTLTRGSITTTGTLVAVASFPHAMTARNPGGTLIVNGTSISTTGLAIGAVSDDGGNASLTDVSMVTRGDRANGLYAVVEQNGPQFAANVTSLRGTVETFGVNAHGAHAQGRNDLAGPLSSISVSDTRFSTHGDFATGLRASLASYGSAPSGRGEAQVVATNATVTTEGVQAHGVVSRDAPTSVTLNGGSVVTSGPNAYGAMAELGGHVIGVGTRVQAGGDQSLGLYVTGNPDAVSRADFSNSTITNTSGPTIGVAGNGIVALTDTTAGGSDQWLRVGSSGDYARLAFAVAPLLGPDGFPDENGVPPPEPPPLPTPTADPVAPGIAEVTATRSTVTGSAMTAVGSVSNLTLVDATWNLTGNSNITNLVNDPSLIDFSAPFDGAFKTLTVVNYSGDGTIALNTVLGDDSSPSDMLVVDGGVASGPSLLAIKDAGGEGAVTVANGILVVSAINGGTTTTNAFALSDRMVAGPYEYTLQRSSVDASAPQSWFLRSTIDCSTPGAPVPPCPEPPVPPVPPPPEPPPPPPPNYRDEVSLYASAVPTAMHYSRSLLDTLHERVGEQEQLRARTDLGARGGVEAMWGRLVYVDGERDSKRGIYGDGPSYDYMLGAVQIGYDVYRRERQDSHRDHVGLYGAIGYAQNDVDHYDGTSAGDDRIDAYTLAGYWTRYGQTGGQPKPAEWYVDAVLQATWYDVQADPDEDMPRLQTDGWGLAASLEGGYPFDLGSGWQLEPQAQIIYQWFDFDDASDLAANVRFDDTTSLVGRLSARISRDWIHHDAPDYPLNSTAWARVGVWHEFEGEPVTSFSSDDGYIPFAVDLTGSWWELELGATREISRNVFFYGNVGYSQGFDDDRRAWEGKLGLRANW